MTPFDFRAQVQNGDPLPLVETDFIFGVSGVSSAQVTSEGINCGYDATLQLTSVAHTVELDVVNHAQATITAWFFASGGWQVGASNSVSSGIQHIKFDFANIGRITFKSTGELYLQTIR